MPELRLLGSLSTFYHFEKSMELTPETSGSVRVNMASSKVARQSTNNICCSISLEEYEKYDIVWLRWGISYIRGVYIKQNTGKFMSEILRGHQLGRALNVHLDGSTGLS
jgi:hypothetical protein